MLCETKIFTENMDSMKRSCLAYEETLRLWAHVSLGCGVFICEMQVIGRLFYRGKTMSLTYVVNSQILLFKWSTIVCGNCTQTFCLDLILPASCFSFFWLINKAKIHTRLSCLTSLWPLWHFWPLFTPQGTHFHLGFRRVEIQSYFFQLCVSVPTKFPSPKYFLWFNCFSFTRLRATE